MRKIIKTLSRIIQREEVYLPLIIFISLAFFMPQSRLGDYDWWIKWTQYITQHGLANFYSLKDATYIPNYMPVYLYVLAGWGSVMNALKLNTDQFIFTLKIVNLIFNFGCFYWAVKIFKHFKLDWKKALFILLNVVLLYNTMIWAQVDSLLIFWILGSSYFALVKKPQWSVVFAVLAMLTKVQAVVFMPYLLVLNLPILLGSEHKVDRKVWLKTIVGAIGIVFIVCLPFILNGQIGAVWGIVTNSVDQYPEVARGAFNFWAAIFGGKVIAYPDKTILWILSYKQWGMLIFLGFNLLLAIPFVVKIWNWRKKFSDFLQRQESWAYVFLLLSLVVQVFYLFPTQMHERYVHPAIVFAGIWMIIQTKVPKWLGYLYFGLLTLAAFLNSESLLMFVPYLNHEKFPFSARLIGILFLITFGLGLYLYKKHNESTD